MKYSTDKDMDHFIRKLLREGWSYERGRKHGRLVAPDGRSFVTIAGSPSDYRGFENFRRDVRKIVKNSSLYAAGILDGLDAMLPVRRPALSVSARSRKNGQFYLSES